MPILEKKDTEFTEAYSLYYSVVFGSIYTKIGKTDIADDLSQEVFIRFYSNMEKVYNIRPWLLSTVKNVLFEFYRKEQNMPDELADAEVNNDIALTFVNGFRDTRIIIDDAIENIEDPVHQSIFDLVAVQNYSYERAGKQLGLNKRQIKYRYGLIVKSVLDFLKKSGIESIEDLL
ncbi:MAG: RNA polymerase sigma factor [bacterium]|nr:RNA polymerase sigma factor [bacterium]